MLNITLNTEKNGIELRFDTKPNTDIITAIKEAGFRWSGKQRMWYAKQDDDTVALANQISESEGSFEYKPKTETNIDLWSLTRTEGIEDNYGKTHITNTKEIAANIRKHLRNRFSMCKWSVTSDYNSIRVELLESPFSRNSEALKAIVNYAYTYAQSWNYDNSDSMTDYFDVNFYGVYKNDIVNYNYNQRECKPNETELETDFLVKKSEFDAEQKKQDEERIKKAVEESKIRQAEYEKAEAERQKKIRRIEENAEIKAVDYTILNAILKANKDDNLDHTEIYDEKQCKETCQVSREVHFTTEVYALFEKQLMSDYSFFDGMGGSRTDDCRIQSSIDYDMMTKEERETVEWYEEHQHNIELAETIEDVSTEIISQNEIKKTWQDEDFDLYKACMKEWIYANKFKLNAGIVRAITIPELKTVMYKVLAEVDSIAEQFKNTNLEAGQRITIVKYSDFGMMSVSKVTFHSYEIGQYAQYDNSVKMTFKPHRKKGLYYKWFYGDVIIYNGWYDLPDTVLFDISYKEHCITQKSKWASFDRKQYDAILEYFAEHGIKPIINTYKPVF